MKKTIMNRLGILLLVLIMIVSVAGCKGGGGATGDSGGAIEVTDDLGNTVSFDKPAEKIVSLAPAQTEIVFALDKGDVLVGRTDYCDYPAAAQKIESIGNYDAPNIEKIVSLSPDLVLATQYLDDNVKSQVEAAGAKVLIFDPKDIPNTEKTIQTIGKVVGAEDKAESLTKEMETKRQEIIEKAKGATTKPKVFIDLGSFYSAGPGSQLDALLNDLGAANIAADTGNEWPQMTAEAIIAANPQVYYSLYPSVEEIKANPGFDQIDAVKNNQIIFHDGLGNDASMIQRPGPRIVDGLEVMAKDIYPDIFK